MISLQLVESITHSRPAANKEVEQVLMTPESLRQQGMHIQLMITAGPKAVSLGDDDHLTALLSVTTDLDLTIFEQDDRIINSLRQNAEKHAVKHYKVVKHDLAFSLPRQYEHSFDLCFSNPPYSSKNEGFGIKVWISRSLQLLRPGGIGLLVIPIQEELPWSMQNMLIVQDYLVKLGCAIIKVEKDVHAYQGANDIALMSSNIWYRVVRPPDVTYVIEDVPASKSLYR